jgi:NarL family two-component system sensor histidine kinase LiaS
MKEKAQCMLSFLKRFLAKFRRLQWKLTFSYILITALAVLVASIVATLILVQFVLTQYPQNASSALLAEAPVVLHDLRPPASHQNLTDDLSTIDYNLQAGYTDPNTGVSAVIPTREGCTVLIDPKGRVLASSDGSVISENVLLSTELSPDGMNIVHAASNSNAVNKPVATVEQQTLYAAIPLFNHQGQLVGILLTTQILPNYGQVVVGLFPLLWPALLLIICSVGIVGAPFGSFMSRWLVRRFKKVTQATESWSQGDFSSMIVDRSGDELGVMTRRLNDMAGKLEHLLQERQNIAVLEERNRMARDLHDSLKQQMFASIMQVWSAQTLLDTNTSAARERLGTIEHLLGQAQQELSTLIHQLRPIALVDKQFTEALRDYCEHWARQQNVMLHLDIADVDLSLKAGEALLRITQEALSNVARHSGASTVEVQLINQQEQVLLNITDNGRGFDLEQARNQGIGLQSMRERMEMLQGTLSIVSKRGQGTCIGAIYIKGNSSRLPEPMTLL